MKEDDTNELVPVTTTSALYAEPAAPDDPESTAEDQIDPGGGSMEEKEYSAHEKQVPQMPDHPCGGHNPMEYYSISELIHNAWPLTRWYFQSSYVYYSKVNTAAFKKEIMSGVCVAILQVPESVAFSFVAGVSPQSGLHATCLLGFLTGAFGGSPGMVSGCAGALAVVMADLTDDNGPLKDLSHRNRVEHLLMCVLFTGIFQMICGILGMARLVKLIPHTAMVGFANGLACIIFLAQFTAFQYCPKHIGDRFDDCNSNQRRWVSLSDLSTWLLLLIVFGTMIIVHYFPRLPHKIGTVIPASLAGLIIATLFEHLIVRMLIGTETRIVSETAPIGGSFPIFHIPNLKGETQYWGTILSYAASLCAIGLIESVMTLAAVDELTELPPSTWRPTQECLAQGLGNLVCGLFSAIGGDAMIGQSTINVMNGARFRLSTMSAGVFMLMIVVVASKLIDLIPIGALTGVLFTVVIHTFNWHTFDLLRKVRKSDALVIVLVTVLAVLTNLAIAVGCGVVVTALVNSWDSGKALRIVEVHSDDGHAKCYRIYGSLFFGSVTAFTQGFDPRKDPRLVLVDFEHSLICDYSALASIYALQRRYEALGKVLVVDNLNAKSEGRMDKHETMRSALPSNRCDQLAPEDQNLLKSVSRSKIPRSEIMDMVTDKDGESSEQRRLFTQDSEPKSEIEDGDGGNINLVIVDPQLRPSHHSRSVNDSSTHHQTDHVHHFQDLDLFKVLPSAAPDARIDFETALERADHDPRLHRRRQSSPDGTTALNLQNDHDSGPHTPPKTQ